ncbi:MAG: HAMP domain-containing histidine kinase [Hyphomicrobiaceae bacterium]|nr:HAMP domain-containing histidine kinase [Hyphomicrobiaceae bacterium]
MSEFREYANPDPGDAAAPCPRAPSKDRRTTARQKVREIRNRLAHGSCCKPDFEYELLCMFARKELSARVALPLLAAIFALASTFWAPVLHAAVWLAVIIAMKLIVVAACRRLLSRPRGEVNLARWHRLLLLLELANGMAWGGIAVVGLGTADATGHVFILACLIVLLAIRMTFASAVMTVLCAGTVPITLAVVARLLAQGDPFYLAMAAIAVGLHAYFIVLARGLNATTLAMLEFRAEKDALIAEIEGEKAICDEARRRAEAASVAKSRFLATMSHELRTPLNAILGFSEVMKGELLGPIPNGSYREYAANIHDSGRHLLQLINEVLDLSRIEADCYELKEAPVRLAGVAEECLRLLNLRAESKGLTVTLAADKRLEPLWADERALRQICLNLLSNALKFTPRGGEVTVTVTTSPDGGQMMVVKDTGPGIPKEEIPRVMQAFGQGSLAQQTTEGGTGLGLPIVQSLVRLHGGTFKLRSLLRKGTEAIVWLPPARVLSAGPCPSWPRPGRSGTAPDDHPGAEADPWWRTSAGRASQQATTGC